MAAFHFARICGDPAAGYLWCNERKQGKAVLLWVNYKSFTCAPPVSVFDTKQGYWQKRKREWRTAGLHGQDGRNDAIMIGGKGLKNLGQKTSNHLSGTSVFDPVLCEVVYNWYCTKGGMIFDPFAGGPTRGVVAELLGHAYIGIDLSERQVDANQINADRLGVCPVWHCDDSRNADQYMPDAVADLIFTCPPYYNLEKYSTHPLDLSNMNYNDFTVAYRDIIAISCRKLKEDRFAVIVVGDIRDSRGAYRDFIGLTKQAFFECGLCLYNEAVLLETYGTAPMRAGLMFRSMRKTAKVHQNVLIFYKGKIREIKNNYDNDFTWADLSALQQKE